MLNWLKNNTTAVYSLAVAVLGLVATFGVNFDQDKVLGVISAVLALVAGFGVRKASLNATAKAREEVPEGYVKLSDVFPPVDSTLPDNDMSALDEAEGANL